MLIDPTALAHLAHLLECTLSLGTVGGGLLRKFLCHLALDMGNGKFTEVRLDCGFLTSGRGFGTLLPLA
jgi:hypothetical protein